MTPAGRDAYLSKRKEGRGAGASLVEIDLILQGQPTLDYSRDGLCPPGLRGVCLAVMFACALL